MKTAQFMIILSFCLFISARSIRRKGNGTIVPETQDFAAEESEQEVQEVEAEPEMQEVDVEPEGATGDQMEGSFILSRFFSSKEYTEYKMIKKR